MYGYAGGARADVNIFHTAVTIGSTRIDDFRRGAAYRMSKSFRDVPSSAAGDGVLSLSPTAALKLMNDLQLRTMQFLSFSTLNWVHSHSATTSILTGSRLCGSR